jgi:phosphotransferase system enzyme I (PtsI)
MIETPAAALISDILAKEVNFFSIGTNDLTQYTLAADRQNPGIGQFCDERHEAVLRLIRQTAANAHEAGIWVGICGELAADLTMLLSFIRMGIDELSVPPSIILPLRGKIIQTDSRY